MRRTAILALLLAFGVAPQALADPPRIGTVEPLAGTRDGKRTGPDAALDELFARLAAAGDADGANGIAALIERRLARSGSDTADLLLSRSGEALRADDAPLAVELLDRVTRMKPDWAEAWSRRATAFFLLEDTADALADLHKALACEPRLYDAWAALGHVELASGNKGRALQAFRRALALHPYLQSAKEAAERLAPEVDGRDL